MPTIHANNLIFKQRLLLSLYVIQALLFLDRGIGQVEMKNTVKIRSQMPRHRLPDSNGKKCQDIGYPD